MRETKNFSGGKRFLNWCACVRPSNGMPVFGLIRRLGAIVGDGWNPGSVEGERSGNTGGMNSGSTNGRVGGLQPMSHSPGSQPLPAQALRPPLVAR
jgi:hypothetical protein